MFPKTLMGPHLVHFGQHEASQHVSVAWQHLYLYLTHLSFPTFSTPQNFGSSGSLSQVGFGGHAVDPLGLACAARGRSEAGTAADTSAVPRTRIARERGIGFTSERASSSRRSLIAPSRA